MGVLNFRTDRLITGVNVIDGNLYWTDDNSEPKKLEIDRFRDYNHTNGQTTIGLDEVIESDLTVIRLHPWQAIDLELTAFDSTADATRPNPPFESIYPRFSYRWKYEDGQFSPYAPFTQAAFMPATRTLTSTGTRGEDNFVPDTEEENYVEGFNTTMFNNVGTITLNNIPRGPRDVVAVQLLYTESISTTIYILEELEIPAAQRGLDYVLSPSYTGGEPTDSDYSLLPLRYQLSARKIFRALPARELSRPYDSVPQIAKAQEITANRLIYGNYRFGPSAIPGNPDSYYQQPTVVNMTSRMINAGTGDGLHVKGDRTYEVGVAYIDAYGRQGPMIQVGSITQDDGSVIERTPVTTRFNQLNREQIEATISSDPPQWADRYRYFIKDTAMDHHSLISYNVYNDGNATDNDSEFVWIEFQSTDRNKIVAESAAGDGNTATILNLRRVNDTVQTTKQRFLVQDIENEAPADVRNQLVDTISNVRIRRLGVANHNQWSDQDRTTTTFGLRDVVDGVNFQIVADVWNTYLQEYGLQRIVHPYDSSTAVNHNLLDPMVDNQSIEVRPLFITFSGSDAIYYRVTSISDTQVGDRHQINLGIGERYEVDPDTGEITATGNSGLINPTLERGNQSITLYTDTVSDAAVERLGGRFWVRTARNGLETIRSQFSFDGELESLQQLWFETEPQVQASQLDLFWETSDTFCVCTEHGYANVIDWFNCVAEVTTGGVYLESTRINDKFNTVQLVKGVKANIPTERSSLEERPYGLIWSGIYNSRTSANRFNEFIESEGIVKELEPNYGSLQKLHTRDTNLIALCEDKCFSILADKDQLFNADGGGNVSASNAVLGQTTPYVGEYGISTNPESFASYGHHIYFTDAKRGVVIQMVPATSPQTQLTELSARGMDDFFRDRLFSADRIIGMYDDYSNSYVLSIQGYNATDAIIDPSDLLPMESGISANATLKYEAAVEGWPSFISYIPDEGVTLNNKFFTFNNGQLWMHNSNTANRNTFYGGDLVASEIQCIFNENPSVVKEFLTVGYEGTENWMVEAIDPENSNEVNWTSDNDNFPFVAKENKFFKPIVTMEPIYEFQNGVIVDSGNTREKSGMKGFFNNVRLSNNQPTKQELFAINTEFYISSN